MARRSRPRRKKASSKTKPLWQQLGFRSNFEYEGAMDLKRRGVEYSFEPYKIDYSYKVESSYIPDFDIGKHFILEFKGYLSPSDRKKYIRVRESNPDVDIRFVFQNPNNKIRRGSKTTYAKWCDKNGFKWADKFVPQSWIEEEHSDGR